MKLNKQLNFFIKKKINSSFRKNYINSICKKSLKIFNEKIISFSKENNFISSIIKYDYSFPIKENIDCNILKKYLIDKNGIYLFFLNGFYLSNLLETKNQFIFSINEIFIKKKSNSTIENFFGKTISNNDIFNSLNFLFSKDGAYIFIPDKICLKKTIYIINLYKIKNDFSIINTRNLIILGKKSKAKIVEFHESLTNKIFFSNYITEIYNKKESNIEYIKLYTNLAYSYLRNKTYITQKKKSICTLNKFSFEGKFLNENINFFSCGKKSKSYFNGLAILKKKYIHQYVKINSLIDHLFSNCESYQLTKSILDGTSKGSFNGKIIIHKKANNIIAFQKNNNILLNKNSYVSSNPELEIFANNVKCSHGSTIGTLDKNKIFYLCTRGIEKKIAKSILLLLDAKKILKNINIPKIKFFLYKKILNILNLKNVF
ncbi:MAG: SufD family Fe-S cluster assembly protein [Candidatus Karelsulcia muelleri]